MDAIEFIKRDPESFRAFDYSLLPCYNYPWQSSFLDFSINKDDVLELITTIENNPILNKFVSIKLRTVINQYAPHALEQIEEIITYFAEGRLGEELYDIYEEFYPDALESIRTMIIYDYFINAEHESFYFLKYIVEHFPRIIYSPGSDQSSIMIAKSFICRFRRTPFNFEAVRDNFEYLKSYGYVITDPSHLDSSIDSETTFKVKQFYGLSTSYTVDNVVNLITGTHSLSPEKEIVSMCDHGLDVNMQIPISNVPLFIRDENLLPNDWRLQHPMLDLVEFVLLMYTPASCIRIIKFLNSLVHLGINHQNNNFTMQLLHRCIAMSKKRLEKHNKLSDIVMTFSLYSDSDSESDSDSDFEE